MDRHSAKIPLGGGLDKPLPYRVEVEAIRARSEIESRFTGLSPCEDGEGHAEAASLLSTSYWIPRDLNGEADELSKAVQRGITIAIWPPSREPKSARPTDGVLHNA